MTTPDFELQKTGVPGERDLEEEVTGVAAGGTEAVPVATTSGDPRLVEHAPAPVFRPPLQQGRPQATGAFEAAPAFQQRDPLTGLVANVSDRDVQFIHSSLLLMDPTLSTNPELVTQMVSGLVSIGAQDPALFDEFLAEPSVALAHSTEDYLKLKTMQELLGQTFGDTGWAGTIDALITATREAYTRREGAIWSGGQLVNDMNAARGSWEAGELELDEAAQQAVVETFRARGTIAGGRVALTDEEIRAAGSWATSRSAAEEAAAALKGRNGEWVYDESGNLNVTITTADGEDTLLWDGLIRLDPGTEINNNVDALGALLAAQAGVAHKLENPDKIPGHQTLAGLAAQTVGGTLRFLQRNGAEPLINAAASALRAVHLTAEARTDFYNPLPNAPTPVAPEGMVEELGLTNHETGVFAQTLEREQNRRKAMATPENMIAAAAQALEGDPNDRVIMAMGLWGGMSEDDQKTALTAAGSVDQEELLEQFRQEREDRGVLPLALEEYVLSPALEFAQTWDRVVHDIGIGIVHTLDFLPGEHEGALEALVNEGFDGFVASYQEAFSNDTFAEFIGLDEGAAASWVNFGASVLFDPFTWITPSGKFQREYMLKQLADPDLARQYVDSNPAFRDLAHQIVDKVDNVQAAEVLVNGGMSVDGFRRLMAIGLRDFGAADDVAEDVLSHALVEGGERAARRTARNEAIQEVKDILYNELPAAGRGGKWIPSGPASLQVRQGTLGFGNVIRNFTKLSEKDRGTVYQIFARAGRHRSMAITEGGYIEDAMRMLTIRYADDAAGWAQSVQRFYDEAIIPFSGNTDEMAAVAAQTTERLTRELDDLGRAMTPEIRRVPKLRKELTGLRSQIDDIQGAIVRATGDKPSQDALRETLERLVRSEESIAAKLDEVGPLFDDGVERGKEIRTQANRARDLKKSAEVPKDRRILEQWVHEFMDDWGDELGVPILEGAPDHPFLPGLKVRDWSMVTGDKSFNQINRQTLDNLSPLAKGSDELAQLRDVGVGDRGWTPLPASTMELVAYRAGQALGDDGWARFLKKTAEIAKKPLDVQQRMFVTTVLTNLVTPVKTNVDEVLRFWTQTGVKDMPVMLQALVGGTPGVGRMVRKHFPVSQRAAGFAEDPLTSASHNWTKLEQGAPGHWQAAERWVNGTLLEDPIFKEYARVMVAAGGDRIVAREAFQQWWDETGAFFTNSTTVSGKELTYQTAFDVLDNSFNYMTSLADDSASVSRRILDAAASGEKIGATNERFWKTMGPIPGEEGLPTGATLSRAPDRVFNTLYGVTGSYRGGVFFDYHYKEALDLYKRSAKVLDEETLIARSGGVISNSAEAQRALAAGQHNAVIRELVAREGFHLERELELQAAQWARNRADDMMYQMGAASLFGRKTQRLYPFGRAQTDFLDYWYRRALEPAQIKVGQKLYNPIGVTGRHLPLNARLHNRWMKLAAQQDQEGDDPAGSPGWMVRRFTFLPTQFDESFLLDVVPSPAPLASWLVNFLPEDAEEGDPWSGVAAAARDFFSEVHPSHEVFANYSNQGAMNTTQNLINSTFPTSGRSLRSGLEAVAKGIIAATGTREAEIIPIVNAMMLQSESPYYRDYMGANFIDFAAEGNDIFAFALSDSGGLQEKFLEMQEKSFSNAYGQDNLDYLKANLAQQNQAGSDMLYIRGYTPMANQVASWFDEGYISKGVLDEFNLNYEVVAMFLEKQGGADVSDKRRFADVASDIFWNLPDKVQNEFVVDHPEMAVNLISNFEVDMDLAPKDLIDDGSISGGRIVARGEAGRDAWRRGFNGTDGAVWIKTRDQEEVWTDRIARAQNHARGYIRDTFEEVTGGLEWSKVTATSGNRDLIVTLASDEEIAHAKRLTETLNVEFPDDALLPDGTYRMTLGEFKDALKLERNSLGGDFTIDSAVERKLLNVDSWASGNTPDIVALLEDGLGWDLEYDASQEVSYYGSQLVQDLKDDINFLDREMDWSSPAEWEDIPASAGIMTGDFDAEAHRAEFRQRLRVAIMLNPNLTVGDYNREYARMFGDLNYEDPDPPPVDQLENAHAFSSLNDFNVVDGDTIQIYTNDGQVVPFRLLGINTPEEHQPGWDEAKTGLRQIVTDAINRGETVTLGSFDPGRYGTTQQFRSGLGGTVVDNERVFAWLYIGGVPVFDPEAFTSLNPRGQGAGEVPNYQALYAQRKQAQSEGGE